MWSVEQYDEKPLAASDKADYFTLQKSCSQQSTSSENSR